MTTPNRAAIAAAAKANTENGIVVFGFVGSTDPGLPRKEYVVVPNGMTRSPFAARAQGTPDVGYDAKFLACLYSDAETVHAKAIPAALKGWVAANRAHMFAAGYLGDEHTIAPAPDTDTTKDTKLGNFPHLAEAVNYDLSRGTLCTFFCSINYWNSNHNTTGNVLPKGQIKIVRAIISAAKTIDVSQITDAVYFGGHACEKRLTLRCILDNTLASALREHEVFNPVYMAAADAWAQMRTGAQMMPAGTAIIGILKIFLNEVKKVGLLGFSPAPQAILTLKAGMDQVKADPKVFHPGAQYLFNENPIALAAVEDLKTYAGVFGGFCRSAGFAISTTSAKHINELIDQRADPVWTNMGKFFAKGVEITEDKIKAASAQYGVSTGVTVPDPSADGAGYKTATDKLVAEFDAITFA